MKTLKINTKLVVRFFLLVNLILSISNQFASAQSNQSEKYPNHYILLIDRSASTVSNETRVREYKDTLLKKLMVQLYAQGFDGMIPPVNPDKDIISLLHFGIVPQGENPPYKYLKNYNLMADFIRLRLNHEKKVSQKRLRTVIWPEKFYKLTLLTWVKQLALASLQHDNLQEFMHRSFLVLVHDGELNESIVTLERTMVEHWSNQQNLGKIKKITNIIDETYLFSNGRGKPDMLWRGRFGTKRNPIFCEVYEVTSRSWEQLKSRLRDFKAFEKIDFNWVKESGSHPQGTLEVELGERFLNYLKDQKVSASISITSNNNQKTDIPVTLDKKMLIPISFSSSLTCEPIKCHVTLNISVILKDKLMGRGERRFRYRRTVDTPIPMRCTATYFLRLTVIFAGILLLLLISYYSWRFRFYTTHIRITFAGLIFPIPVRRNKMIEGHTPVHPSTGKSAFTIHFPPRLIQFIFYRKARIYLNQDNNNYLYWVKNSEKKTTISFPTKDAKINIWWNSIPTEPITLTLTFEQGNQNTGICLSFPKGISGGE